MSMQNLIATRSAVFDANGAATAVVKPDVGQFWYPTVVRVATAKRGENLIPYCAVYHSNAAAAAQPADFVDDTFTGDNDATGMFNGVCVPYAEAITAKWEGGVPGDSGILRVYGIMSDTPPASEPNVATLLGSGPTARFRNTLTSGTRDLRWTLLSQTDADIDTNETFALGFVGRVPAIGVYFLASTNHFDVRFTYYLDPAYTTPVGTGIRFVIRSGQTFDQTIPVLGPYARVEITPSAVNSGYTIEVRSATAHYKGFFSLATGNLLVAATGVVIAPAGVRTDTPQFVAPGWATWSVDTSAVDWFAEIESINETGITRLIDRLEEKAGNQRRTIYLPMSSIQIRTGNNDGVNRTFFITLCSHPLGIVQ